jgi:hypothetical protein
MARATAQLPEGDLATLQETFTRHLRDPERVPIPERLSPRRVAVYRELVFENIFSLLSNFFPVISSLFPEAQWRALVAEFIRDFKAETPYFPQLGQEFIFFLAERASKVEGKPFLLELAHYEAMELELYLSEELSGEVLSADDLHTGALRLSPLAMPLSYHFPVHQINPDFQPQLATAQPTFLLMFRDDNDNVRFFELQNLNFQLISSIQNSPGNTAQQHLSALFPNKDLTTEQFLAQGQHVLKQFNDLRLLRLA